ncbi:MAG: hypothetical protein NUV77_22045 [Thermoguttaceae bacterium]|jgi:hypothetical protein|nr:hypothetical protein [Thermoguttaceae bacterium]
MDCPRDAGAQPRNSDAADAAIVAHARALDARFADLEATQVDEGPISHTLSLLKRLSIEHGIAMVVVGGIAGSLHGLRRATEDVDIVIDQAQLALFCEKAVEAGFLQEGPTRLALEGGYPVDILVSGTYPAPDSLHPVPTPGELGVAAGLEFADLPAWITLKLLAGRPEDVGDVYRLLRRKSTSEREELRGRVDARVRRRYERIVQDLGRRLS